MTDLTRDKTLALVLEKFGCKLEDCQVSHLGNGLINNTYLVQAPEQEFVLQCLNQQVFTKPQQVTNNADLISAHLQAKRENNGYPLTPVFQLKCLNKQNHVKVAEQYWRALQYIPQSFTLEVITSLEQAKSVAQAFAQFTSALSDFDSKKLAEIIPNFHDLTSRVSQLEQAIKSTSAPLLISAKAEIEFIQSQSAFIKDIIKATATLPLHVTHNDTKINNLLFSQITKKPIAVIDLDTCMPGYLMHDFGDMVRTCCVSIAEDSTELDNMVIDFDMLKVLTQGYLNGFNGVLSTAEQNSLLLGIKLMPFMLSIRFLTDFLTGDTYFKTHYAKHNVDRAKNQLHLYKLFCQHDALITEIVLQDSVVI